MKDGADMDEAAGMDPQDAAVIMQEARARAERDLNIRHPVIFASWALVYLLGYGVVWLSVRGQQPYRAPAGWALALLALLAVMALGVTAMVTDRATEPAGPVASARPPRRAWPWHGARHWSKSPEEYETWRSKRSTQPLHG